MYALRFLFPVTTKANYAAINPAFGKYLDAYTSGVVSKKNTIRVQLASDAATTHVVNETIKETLFTFSPAVEGKAYWTDARTIEFKPDNDLRANQLYEVSFELSKVLNVPSTYSIFHFNVQTLKPSFEINEYGLKSSDKETMSLSGEIETADVEESARVAKLLNASLGNTPLKILWQHNEANKTHDFIINNIQRKTVARNLVCKLEWRSIKYQYQRKKEIIIPAIGDFQSA